ncbi:MAG: MFS transporter, partial [Bdellovibrionales bacterium]|nr:MFS transporter [Bdellovibrionales bacterium]
MIRHNRFSPLFWTQFFGALNDNFLKNSLVMLITFKGIKLFGFESSVLVAFAGGIFILPFFLFSTHAGQLADKYEKSFLVVVTKIWEVGIALIASVGFYLESYGILLLLLFLMGVQSTFFGPLKYSIIPDLVEKEDLTEANAYVEMGTFVSILLGTIAGGLSTNIENSTAYIITGLITVSIFGLIASRRLPKIGKGQSQLKIKLNPIPSMVDLFRNLAGQKILFQSIIAISWFWFFGAGILSILPVFGREFLRVGPDIVTAFLAMFTLGIGIGSLICNKLSFKQVEIGLVPLGA